MKLILKLLSTCALNLAINMPDIVSMFGMYQPDEPKTQNQKNEKNYNIL